MPFKAFPGLILSSFMLLNLSPVWGAAEPKPAPDTAAHRSRFEQLELFNKVLYLIENQYYRTVSTEKLIEGALKGMMETLDPHTSFLNEQYFKKMQSDTSGEFGGLGIEVTQRDGMILVISPIDDSPAFRAGIRPRDRIVEINNVSIVGQPLDEVIERMRGKNGDTIQLGIVRDGSDKIKSFKLKRETIKVNPVKSELLDGRIAYIRLTQFQKRAGQAVEEALKNLKEKASKSGGLVGIILDLRSNPGGLLDQAVDVSSIFLKEGIVVSTEARDPQNKDIRYVKKQGFKDLETPLIVLINGASASASEIVAGAIQDFQRGPIMGLQSFGKGSVQTVAQLDGKVGVKLTIAQYLTPKGRRIQGVGIVPDIQVDDLDYQAFLQAKRLDRYVRERDLRNHLTATIESAEEKKLREEWERQDRANKREEQKKKVAQTKTSEEEDVFTPYAPAQDYQVQQASQLLKTLKYLAK
jgi:carboxyl-terminal processing protease